jgi:hypothetical protein
MKNPKENRMVMLIIKEPDFLLLLPITLPSFHQKSQAPTIGAAWLCPIDFGIVSIPSIDGFVLPIT